MLYNIDNFSEKLKKEETSIETILNKMYAYPKKDELFKLGEKHNVDIGTIAYIIYDYEIWEAASSCKE